MAETDRARVGTSLAVRILGWAACLVVGGVLGALGTVMHQATVRLGTVPIPYGYALSVLGLALFLFGVRLATSRVSAAVAAVGAIVVVGVLSLKSPGGSVLIPATLLGYLWTFTPSVLGLLAVAWPLRRAR